MNVADLKSKIAPLAEKYGLKLIVLFGSQVSGKTHRESDYDIAYLSKKELSLEEESGFMYGLMPILKIRDERLVNIVDMKTAGPLMLYSITNKGRVLFEREIGSFFALKIYAWKVFVDTQSFRDNCFRIVKKRIQAM
ncbi:hypothetical protein A3H53_03675 [Candidatus Nomurabacteria bacterium RIFCSPLOWO2_02_FULL_40_10]|uniref:Polymerase beta nucleotidyltransferase domain-containing protein n=2 Tax=Candidatus Nomuraibacteriota TaxID=1752729 RepID=A0A1F6XVQ7_9BACT|nr:MAG: hypothetical protein A2642_00975 [Candidatus Nomurabacteria bacterium RIFCSPHIGHO2_01_FULL_39_10]OGI98215.1 MAG: hypothetical protein A3H53_03675 [Candidatus Nomurabacteria bacterium RIFCSPLOWO2_02_FULL_40_10]